MPVRNSFTKYCELSQVRAQLAALSTPTLKQYRAMLVRISASASTPEVDEYFEEVLRIVDYMLEEQADLTF